MHPKTTPTPTGLHNVAASIPNIALVDFQSILPAQAPELILERFASMMGFLIDDVLAHRIYVSGAD